MGQSLAAEVLKSGAAKTVGTVVGGAVGGLPGALVGGAAGWATQKGVERYGGGLAKRIPDGVRTRFTDTVDTVTTKADMWASDVKIGYDAVTGGVQSDGAGGSGRSDSNDNSIF
ncbi:hypothetical protein HISP_16110 [Haloarcula hispanica N601]|uniref:Uncharacterized protein n=2 Tax=Haloarcula hispanica TaxID=51589 RepID=V5TT03_HALHI|nr:hypothetical protein HAH_4061 [Haloarcula hispanica ATCC 33960]AHB67830.2 hypothetical protein HISP_16110 [Haloarcula hispanica N601]